jgi:4-amino-4-deoxy-L-arabinose transferase-like glycosyltransferase
MFAQQQSAAAALRSTTPTWLAPILLSLIVALALGLRLWGLGWSLPWPTHPDERTPVDQARAMLASGDLGPEDFKNPSLFIYMIAVELTITRALGSLAGPLACDVPGSTHLLARLTSALMGSASVVVLYAIGDTLFGRRVGLLAALFLAVSFIKIAPGDCSALADRGMEQPRKGADCPQKLVYYDRATNDSRAAQTDC